MEIVVKKQEKINRNLRDSFEIGFTSLSDNVLLAIENNEIVALCDMPSHDGCEPEDVFTEECDVETLEIHIFGVKAGYAGRGIGTRFVAELQARFDAIIATEVLETARAFWFAAGFEDDGNDEFTWFS